MQRLFLPTILILLVTAGRPPQALAIAEPHLVGHSVRSRPTSRPILPHGFVAAPTSTDSTRPPQSAAPIGVPCSRLQGPIFAPRRWVGRLALQQNRLAIWAASEPSGPPAQSLTIYAYDSFSAKGALGAWIAEQLEKREKIKTRFVSFGSAGEALNQIILEGTSTAADLLVGVDNALVARAVSSGHFLPSPPELEPAKLEKELEPGLNFDRTREFLPFDYGYFSFIYDSRRLAHAPVPRSLKELAESSRLKHEIVIEDPRTSSVGLGFLIWTFVAFGHDKAWPSPRWDGFWRSMQSQLASIVPGWSGAYGLFLKGEAQYVLSYSTSPAYHREVEHKDYYRALDFAGGHYRQVEGAGVVRYSKQPALAARWLRFLLSPEAQAQVALRQWMYPARRKITLPASFRALPVPRALSLPPEEIERVRARLLSRWTELAAGRK